MPQLQRRLTVSALSTDSVGTVVTTANAVGGSIIPQKYINGIWLRQLGGMAIEWRGPLNGTLVQQKITIPSGEPGYISGMSKPAEVELFLAAGQAAALEVQLVIDYAEAME